MAIFSRIKKPGEDEDNPIIDGEAELELPAKPGARPPIGNAPPNRPVAMPPIAPTLSVRAGAEHATEVRATEPRPYETKIMEGKPVADTTRTADMARRLVDSPQQQRAEPELRKLTVGREISLQGEITHCDHLVVEGSVIANLAGCHQVEIMESGLFKGSVDIDQIEVRGLFEGTMNVSGRLAIRSTGRVVGNVQYGQIEIENGGQISGEVQAQSQPPSQASGAKNPLKQVAAAGADLGMRANAPAE
jgi:cytoskeletal protein CcmA (bactofilin family)